MPRLPTTSVLLPPSSSNPSLAVRNLLPHHQAPADLTDHYLVEKARRAAKVEAATAYSRASLSAVSSSTASCPLIPPIGKVVALTLPDELALHRRKEITEIIKERVRSGAASATPIPLPPPLPVTVSRKHPPPTSKSSTSLAASILKTSSGSGNISSAGAGGGGSIPQPLPRSRYEAAATADRIDSVLARAATLEKLEAFHTQMASVTSREVNRWWCGTCVREYEKEPLMCRAERHPIEVRKRMMHALACIGCDTRILHVTPHAAHACVKCGGRDWLVASIHRIKGGAPAGAAPSLEGLVPKLLPRGIEQNFSLRS